MRRGTNKSARNDLIELFRYVCAIGIVWMHSGGSLTWVGNVALLVFVILSVNFALMQKKPTWARIRVLKLWMFWSVVYAVLKTGQAAMERQPISADFEWWMLVTGSVLPLWFLPFIYVANGLASSYNTTIKGRYSWLEIVMLPCLTIGSALLSGLSFGIPFNQWFLGVSGVLIAISIFRSRNDVRYSIAMTLILFAAFLAGVVHEVTVLLIAFMVAGLALLRAPNWRSKLAARLGTISLGVYVLHHGVAVLTREIIPVSSIRFEFVLTALISTLLALIMNRMPIVKKFT